MKKMKSQSSVCVCVCYNRSLHTLHKYMNANTSSYTSSISRIIAIGNVSERNSNAAQVCFHHSNAGTG